VNKNDKKKLKTKQPGEGFSDIEPENKKNPDMLLACVYKNK